jgi:hypothetical protein
MRTFASSLDCENDVRVKAANNVGGWGFPLLARSEPAAHLTPRRRTATSTTRHTARRDVEFLVSAVRSAIPAARGSIHGFPPSVISSSRHDRLFFLFVLRKQSHNHVHQFLFGTALGHFFVGIRCEKVFEGGRGFLPQRRMRRCLRRQLFPTGGRSLGFEFPPRLFAAVRIDPHGRLAFGLAFLGGLVRRYLCHPVSQGLLQRRGKAGCPPKTCMG